ncbi:hypothetical protein HanXRQr2_Chr05g0235321 [Helianthus annuus]|uniref:Transmembrane protein n=1 Tax=Helianthus annuus TaxID=4232 RepID=A0A251UTF6_HELAN|nr:uncharacterized protein LOC110942198 [Helianthus annuus]KAF5807586.1 hypothetical protein HanXRQr2_Chr05g0235321 [Helianthus annuus]KAJ0571684.1 hypothetical protein HanHA300_Chr05g0192891 [Helianthus annuus]
MDQRMEEMKFMGFSSIISHSFKTIFTWKKTFSLITLTLILPLTLIFIAHMQFSYFFYDQIEPNPFQLFLGAFDSYKSYYNQNTTTADDWRSYFLFKFITLAIITILCVLSTACIVYTIASDYTGREVTYTKSMKVVPKVWKRLTLTLLCMYLSLFAYALIASVAIFVCSSVVTQGPGNVFMLIYGIIYIYWFLYLSIILQIASVVSVLESSYGIKAMIKAMDLMNGKRKTALAVSYVLYQFLVCVVYVYMAFVVYNNAGLSPVWRVAIGIICGLLFVVIFLLFVASETVLYLVCKLHHGETIDPTSLSTYLSSYLSDSRPVFRTGEDIQLGRPQNQLVSHV